MKTLYESIFDIDKNIDDDSAICMASYWKPITFSCSLGPVELLNLLKKFDYKKLKQSEKNVNINTVEYYVMRPWNKKAVQDKVYELIKPILSQHNWVEVFKLLEKCSNGDFVIRNSSAPKDVFKLYIEDTTTLTWFEIMFEKK